jgi:hypothetical protein
VISTSGAEVIALLDELTADGGAIARAIATRCRSPPDSWAGRCVRRCREADALERRARQLAAG